MFPPRQFSEVIMGKMWSCRVNQAWHFSRHNPVFKHVTLWNLQRSTWSWCVDFRRLQSLADLHAGAQGVPVHTLRLARWSPIPRVSGIRCRASSQSYVSRKAWWMALFIMTNPKLYVILMQNCGCSRGTLAVPILCYRFVLQIRRKQAKRSSTSFFVPQLRESSGHTNVCR